MRTKLLFLTFSLILGLVYSQESTFGFNAGYTSANSKASIDSEKFSGSEGGIYVGILGDLNITETLHFQTGISYLNIESINFLQIPLLMKIYPVANNGFNLQGGLQLTYTLEKVARGFTKLNLALGTGFGYDFSDHVFAELRYSFQFNNYITDPNAGDATSRINFLNIGLGYKF